jgi:hypothetical protein
MRDRGWLAAILVLAAALRLYGLGHGLPFVYNPDEANIMARALSIAQGPDPGYYVYPSFFFYYLFALMGGLFVAGRLLGRYDNLSDFETRFFEDPTDFYLAGRLASVVFALATVVLVGRLVGKHFGAVAGRAAAFFVAVAYFHVRDAHYLKHDVPAGFLVALALWAIDRALSKRDNASHALAGGILGISFATHYYLIFLAPAFVSSHLARWGREGFSRVILAGAVSALTFFCLSPFAVLHLGTTLEHMRANRQVVMDRSLDAGAVLFPSAGRYLDFLLDQGLGYLLVALVVAGFYLMVRRGLAVLALWGGFPLLFFAFISYTFFAGRYFNPMLPSLAAAAGLALASIEKRFGGWASVVVALLAAIQPLFHAVQVDRLFAERDTRTLAREWILENIPSGRTVALQSYSVPLPQSAESVKASLETNGALSELERRGKYAHLLERAERETTAYRLIFLGKGDEHDRTYVGYDELLSGLEPLRDRGVTDIALRLPPTPPPAEVEALFQRVPREGALLARFSPFRHETGEPSWTPYLDNEDWPPSPYLVRPGPFVYIWSIGRP